MQDSIHREININASRDRVYKAISDPVEVVKWFPETIEGDFVVGEQPVFGFGEHGKNRVYVVDAKPVEYFAFRWIPGGNHFLGDVLSVATTLVEFHLSEEPGGSCKVTVSETGFASLPAEIAESSHKQNSGGWEFMLGRLLTYLADS